MIDIVSDRTEHPRTCDSNDNEQGSEWNNCRVNTITIAYKGISAEDAQNWPRGRPDDKAVHDNSHLR